MSNATLMIPYKCVSMGAFIEKNFDFSVGTVGLMMLVTDFRLATTAISNTRIPEKYVHHMRSRRTMFWTTPYSLFLPSTIILEVFSRHVMLVLFMAALNLIKIHVVP